MNARPCHSRTIVSSFRTASSLSTGGDGLLNLDTGRSFMLDVLAPARSVLMSSASIQEAYDCC
jgi:hypothetical protein